MQRRRTYAVAVGTFGLVAALLGVIGAGGGATAAPSTGDRGAATTAKTALSLPTDFEDVTAIGGLSQPVAVAFAPDGTAFVGLQTGDIKSFDYSAATDTFEPAATSTDFADLSIEVDNYGDRGLTGIAVDPTFPARPYVYVNYTYNVDPTGTSTSFPAWGNGAQYDDCPAEADLTPPGVKGCPVMMRVSRLTAQRTTLGWQLVPGSELPLLTEGCFQFDSHSSGDVVFGPDGKLYASAGDGASYKGTDHGQAQNVCGDPMGGASVADDQGGALRAQDARNTTDPLGIDGTIFRLDPDAVLSPSAANAGQWLVAYGQRNPWRLTFRPGTSELWSVDVGSSNWEEINRLPAATATAAAVNRGWPCYEGVSGVSTRNTAWDDLNVDLCETLYSAGPAAVQAPYFSYRGRTGAAPLTPGENCGPVVSSSMSGVAFTPATSDWPATYQSSLYFSDFLRKCIWRLGKLPNGDPDPSSIQVFAQQSGTPVQLVVGPGGDLYYVDYGVDANGVVQGGGGVHRIQYDATSQLTVKSSPKKVKIKVAGKKHKAKPYKAEFAVGSTVKLVAPKSFVKGGVRYVFSRWKGVAKKKKAKKRKQKIEVGATAITVKAVYQRARPPADQR
jgi:glucose/arabinose dehydrogenase